MANKFYLSQDITDLPVQPTLLWLNSLFKPFLASINLLEISKMTTEDNKNQIQLFKPQAHLGLRLFDQKSFNFCFYTKDKENIKKLQDLIHDTIGFQRVQTDINFGGSENTVVSFSDQMPKFITLLNNVKFIAREQTQYQELKVYDTQTMGRCLILDDCINISDLDMEDNYTIQISRHIFKMSETLDNVLVIGGGDCLVANYLLKNCPNIKKVTHCEIDQRVQEATMKYFGNFQGWVIQENYENGRYQIFFDDAAKFVKTCQDCQFDGIIIDSTDTWNEDSPSYILTTPDFYKDLHRILKSKCGFSQMMSQPTMEKWFIARWKQGGFTNDFEVYQCPTPQYGGYTPLGYVYKQ